MLLPEIPSLVVVHLITVDFSVMILIIALHNLVKMGQLVSQQATHIIVVALKVLEELTVITLLLSVNLIVVQMVEHVVQMKQPLCVHVLKGLQELFVMWM